MDPRNRTATSSTSADLLNTLRGWDHTCPANRAPTVTSGRTRFLTATVDPGEERPIRVRWSRPASSSGLLLPSGDLLHPREVRVTRGVTLRLPLSAAGGSRSSSDIASGYEGGRGLDSASHADLGRVHVGWVAGHPHGTRRRRRHARKSVCGGRSDSRMQDRLRTAGTPVVGKCWLRPTHPADALRPQRSWRHRRNSLV
jgi:hypothetical protein